MVKEQFYGLRWFRYSEEEQYLLNCFRDGFFTSFNDTFTTYPDRGSKVHWEYWAKHKLLVPEGLNDWGQE